MPNEKGLEYPPPTTCSTFQTCILKSQGHIVWKYGAILNLGPLRIGEEKKKEEERI